MEVNICQVTLKPFVSSMSLVSWIQTQVLWWEKLSWRAERCLSNVCPFFGELLGSMKSYPWWPPEFQYSAMPTTGHGHCSRHGLGLCSTGQHPILSLDCSHSHGGAWPAHLRHPIMLLDPSPMEMLTLAKPWPKFTVSCHQKTKLIFCRKLDHQKNNSRWDHYLIRG